MASFFAHASRLFGALRQNQVAFNSVTGCTLFAGSDAMAQQIEESGEEAGPAKVADKHHGHRDDTSSHVVETGFNSWRAVSAGVIGIFFGGFVYPFAYAKLDAMWKGVTVVTTLKKSVVEIATVGIFVNSLSISSRGLLVGRTSDDVARHTLEEMPTVTVNDAKVWLPYNLVAFSLIPIYIRPATTSLMEACWQTYISLCSHSYEGGENGSEPEQKQSIAPL